MCATVAPVSTTTTTRTTTSTATPSIQNRVSQLIAGSTPVPQFQKAVNNVFGVGQTTTTTTSTTPAVTVSCIPAAAVIKTTQTTGSVTNKVYERVLDVKTLTGLGNVSSTVFYLPEFENAQQVILTQGGVVNNYYVLVRNTTVA